ncbi:MAG TPA: hypothetical protein VHA52_09090 [Candidatus Babeliaceae bacterium]|nr:hypothetical protein [Candidatus Babeliaceae bacterium]
MKEEWIRWQPLSNLAEKYYIDALIYNKSLKILLSEENDDFKKILVTFESRINAFRFTEESYRLKLFGDLREQYTADFFGRWTFFKVSNSSYIQWLFEQSIILRNSDLTHFSVIGGDEVVDIVSTDEPKVEFVNFP